MFTLVALPPGAIREDVSISVNIFDYLALVLLFPNFP